MASDFSYIFLKQICFFLRLEFDFYRFESLSFHLKYISCVRRIGAIFKKKTKFNDFSSYFILDGSKKCSTALNVCIHIFFMTFMFIFVFELFSFFFILFSTVNMCAVHVPFQICFCCCFWAIPLAMGCLMLMVRCPVHRLCCSYIYGS